MTSDLLDLVARLKADDQAFCLATVVRTVSVTAAKAGAKAVIRADGTLSDGWIGGGCARGAVLKAAREALADGRPRLVSVMPEDRLAARGVHPGEEREGVRFASNHCPSQGTMDVFVEPMLPRPQLLVLGASPVAVALAELARPYGYRVTVCAPAGELEAFGAADARMAGYDQVRAATGASFAVVATQGRGDVPAARAALALGAAYTGFVGSVRKLAALRRTLAESGEAASDIARLKGPAGLDLGAITPEEIALSILAEILAVRRAGQRLPSPPRLQASPACA